MVLVWQITDDSPNLPNFPGVRYFQQACLRVSITSMRILLLGLIIHEYNITHPHLVHNDLLGMIIYTEFKFAR